MRLAKYIANCGVVSRRKAEELVRNGHIKVNKQVILDPASSINPEQDIVSYKNKNINLPDFKYILLNKPTGYTTTTSDRHAQKLITELVPSGLLPVGRLDKETSGLIIMTNDGDLIYRLTHPKFEHLKVYIAETKKPLTTEEILKIKSGLVLEDGPIKPDNFESLGNNKYKIVIHEGRNRIVRRIFDAIGKPLATLDRISIAGITDDKLKIGEYRLLTDLELAGLKK